MKALTSRQEATRIGSTHLMSFIRGTALRHVPLNARANLMQLLGRSQGILSTPLQVSDGDVLARSYADMARLLSISWRRSPLRTACSTELRRNLLVNSGSWICPV